MIKLQVTFIVCLSVFSKKFFLNIYYVCNKKKRVFYLCFTALRLHATVLSKANRSCSILMESQSILVLGALSSTRPGLDHLG